MKNFYLRILISLILAPIIMFLIFKGGIFFNFLLIFIFILGTYEIFILKKRLIKIALFILLLLFLFCIYNIRILNHGFDFIIFCLFLTWLSDSGGYAFGKIIGGKKINIISPNKTYSGFIGSVLLPQILIFYPISLNFFLDHNILSNSFLIFILSLAAISGDLFFSYFKRVMKIKDYSKLIPGHGGLFDRIDSLIFVILSFFILYKL